MRPIDACAGLIILTISASQPDIVSAQESAPPSGAASKVDANAMAALDKMGAELRSHQMFELTSDVTHEDVLGDGQKLQYSGTIKIQARRPDRFKISAISDERDREIFYDGKTVTVYSPRLGYYASFDGGPTIRDTLKLAAQKYGVELPLSDLFTWGEDKSLAARVKSAFYVRPEHVNGQLCDHYAFRQERVDWQIWIQKNGPALPCKLVITNRVDPSMPQYASVMHWSFPTTIADDVFAFSPPSSARKIQMAQLSFPNLKGRKP